MQSVEFNSKQEESRNSARKGVSTGNRQVIPYEHYIIFTVGNTANPEHIQTQTPAALMSLHMPAERKLTSEYSGNTYCAKRIAQGASVNTTCAPGPGVLVSMLI